MSEGKTKKNIYNADPTLRRENSKGNEASKQHVINSKYIYNSKSFNTMLLLWS